MSGPQSKSRCTVCWNLVMYCTCLEGTPESRHPSAAPPRHLHAVPDEPESGGESTEA